jgi:hypothetical protein
MLEPKIEGKYWLGAWEGNAKLGATTESEAKGVAEGWHTPNQLCNLNGQISAGYGSLAGYPATIGPGVFAGASEEGCTEGFKKIGVGPTIVYRAPSRFHMGMARRKTTLEVAEVEAAGHAVQHVTPHGIGHEGGPSTRTAVEGALLRRVEGADRKLEEAEKHWIETAPSAPGGPEGAPETPLPGTATVPSCPGNGAECKSALEAAGFTSIGIGVREWRTADVTKPANAVVNVSPATGSVVETSHLVTVETNPAAMPRVIPSVAPNEAWTTYKSALETAGYTTISERVLPESEYATRTGPNDVTRVKPSEGTRTDPAETTEVKVEVNPPTAPTPGLPEGPECGLTAPHESLNTTPITSIKAGTVFPFSMLVFAKNALTGLATTPERPNQGFFVFGEEVGSLSFLSNFDEIVGIWRGVLAFLLTVAAALYLWRRTLGS